jgi:DNA-binding transcriptional LysR family regulator
MDWRDIPSLSALRGFEAAARLRSLSGAARELNVTHAAVAQHVRALEERFGCKLLERDGRGMKPTRDGAALAAGLSEGFAIIAAAVRDLSRGEDRPLRVALTPSFAENWLMPVIGGFWSAHPEIRLELIPAYELVDLRADGIDLAIRYGRGGWPGTDPTPLVGAGHVVVATPDYTGARCVDDLAELSDCHWLLEKHRAEEQLWARDLGLDLSTVRLSEFDTNTMLLQAVRAGAGVSIVPRAIVARDLAEGRLVALCEALETGLAYHMIRRPGNMSKQLKTFVSWLRQVAAADQR